VESIETKSNGNLGSMIKSHPTRLLSETILGVGVSAMAKRGMVIHFQGTENYW
jgi:hypothetical protein